MIFDVTVVHNTIILSFRKFTSQYILQKKLTILYSTKNIMNFQSE